MKKLILIALFALVAIPLNAVAQIEAGGVIQISIQGVPPTEMSRINATYPVSEKGYISMWPNLTIKASGLKTDVLARKIEAAYRNAEIYTSPTIQIIADSGDKLTQQLVTVGGKVRSPGPKAYSRGMTLFDAVMAAGGPTEFGAMNRVKLYRNGKVYTYDLTKGAHKLLQIYPKDTIDIPQKNWIGG